MLDGLSWGLVGTVGVLLLVGLTRQFTTVGPRGQLLDALAIVPQWKFFGQARIASDPACFDDLCLLARASSDEGDPGAWENVLWWEDRRISQAFWNPGLRRKSVIGESMMLLAMSAENGTPRARPTALAYLTVLRYCLDHQILADGAALQFAIASTRGRGDRLVALRVLSEWHTP